MKNRKTGIALALTCLVAAAWAQTPPTQATIQTNQLAELNWLMGNSPYWMVMNRGSLGTAVMTGKHTLGAGGASAATDPETGQLLFYTDGRNVYGAAHTLCANGDALDGDPAYDQPSAIGPWNSAGKYVIFTNGGGGVKYSVVQMAVPPNTLPNVVTKNTEVGASAGAGLITVPHPNGTSFYVIYQSAAPSKALQVVTAAPGNADADAVLTMPQTVTLANAPDNFTVKNFAYNKVSKTLAITTTSANGTVILVTVGETPSLAYKETVTAGFEVSDSEFTLKGDYLFLSKKGTGNNDGGVWRYKVSSNVAPVSVMGTAVINAGHDLQFAADGNIYHIYQASGSPNYLVGRLTETGEMTDARVKYNLTVNENKIRIDNLGGARFPSFLPPKNLSVTADFEFTGTCLKAPTVFFPKTTPTADSVQWSFLETDQKKQTWSPVYRFKDASNQVKMTAYYNGEKAEITKPVNLTTVNLKLVLPQDTTACSCELTARQNKNVSSCTPPFEIKVKATDANGQSATPASYFWSTGVTTTANKTAVDSAGYYYVAAKDAGGCTAYAGTTVNEYGQNFNHKSYWYFGNKAWLDFTNRRRTTLPPDWLNNMNAAQGCNLACDFMGNPIFYTDGMTVWDRKGRELATEIGGSAGTQVEVMQVPTDTALFYIFTPNRMADGKWEMRYSLFDLKQVSPSNDGIGKVTIKNQLLFSSSSERIFYDKDGGWLAGHEGGNNIFRAYKITSEGIGQPRTSAIGTVHDVAVPNMAAGQIKLSAAKNILAVAISKTSVPPADTDFNRAEFFHFDTDIGLMSDLKTVDCGREGQVYGVAISKGGTKLFVSVRNGGSNSGIHEFAIKSPGAALNPIDPPFPLGKINGTSANENLGAMNYAPDDQLYISTNGGNSLGQISAQEVTTANGPHSPSAFNPSGAQLPTPTTSNWGLPTWSSVSQGAAKLPSATINPNPACVGSPVTFTASVDKKIDSITWDLDNEKGGKQFRNKSTAEWTYPVSKIYNPKLLITNRCIQKQQCNKTLTTPTETLVCNASNDSLIVKMRLEVSQKLKDLNIPNPAFICLSSSVTLDANQGNLNGPNSDLTFLWEGGGETTPTITRSEPGRISKVTVTKNGCTVDQKDIFIADNRPSLVSPPDAEKCQGERDYSLDVDPAGSNLYTNFQWTINGANAGVNHKQDVNTDNPGVFTYEATATRDDPDPSRRCVSRESITVTVKPKISVQLTPVNATECNGNGQINILINASVPPSGPYTYTVNGTVVQTGVQAGNYLVSALPAGTHTVLVTDAAGLACPNSQTTGISGPGVFEWRHEILGPNCDRVQLKVTTINNSAGNPVPISRYKITDSEARTWEDLPVQPSGNSFSTSAANKFPRGTYTVEVRDVNDCPIIKNIDLNPAPNPVISISQQCLKLTAAGASAYEWTASAPNTIVTNPPAGTSIEMKPGAGRVTYTVKGTTGECSSSTSEEVDVPAALQPSIASSSPCGNTVTLTASPVGSFAYRWKKDGTFVNALTGGQTVVDIADNGSKWIVEVRDDVNRCLAESPPTEAKIVGTLDLNITSTLACEGGNFTLTATTATTGVAYAWFLNNLPVKGAADSKYTTVDEGTFKAVISKLGCEASKELSVKKQPAPQGQLPSRLFICADPENLDPATAQVVLDAGKFVSYEWKKGGTVISVDQTATVTEAGTYQVTFKGENNCPGTQKTEVLMDCVPKVIAPNAFRPLSTEEGNRTFSILSYFITDDFQILIYNRWGELVFESASRNFKWNGGFLNDIDRPVPSDMYAYIVKYNAKYNRAEEGRQEKRGGILVVR